MKELTIFTVPKPFKGEVSIIQKNAIGSWLALGQQVEVMLFGQENGVAEISAEMGLRHLPVIEKNHLGTPLLDTVFECAAEYSSAKTLCYVNADIILLRDFFDAVKRIPFPEFLMVGQRWDCQTTTLFDFSDTQLTESLIKYAKTRGRLHEPAGSDYFVFPRHLSWRLPPFAVGRPGWDNWLIYRARSMRVPVIDATPVTTVIHQDHDYSHVPFGVGNSWEGAEADQNRALAGGGDYIFTLVDATHLLKRGGLKRTMRYKYLARSVHSARVLIPAARPFFVIRDRLRGRADQ